MRKKHASTNQAGGQAPDATAISGPAITQAAPQSVLAAASTVPSIEHGLVELFFWPGGYWQTDSDTDEEKFIKADLAGIAAASATSDGKRPTPGHIALKVIDNSGREHYLSIGLLAPDGQTMTKSSFIKSALTPGQIIFTNKSSEDIQAFGDINHPLQRLKLTFANVDVLKHFISKFNSINDYLESMNDALKEVQALEKSLNSGEQRDFGEIKAQLQSAKVNLAKASEFITLTNEDATYLEQNVDGMEGRSPLDGLPKIHEAYDLYNQNKSSVATSFKTLLDITKNHSSEQERISKIKEELQPLIDIIKRLQKSATTTAGNDALYTARPDGIGSKGGNNCISIVWKALFCATGPNHSFGAETGKGWFQDTPNSFYEAVKSYQLRHEQEHAPAQPTILPYNESSAPPDETSSTSGPRRRSRTPSRRGSG